MFIMGEKEIRKEGIQLEILSSGIVQKVRLFTSQDIIFARNLTKANELDKPVEIEHHSENTKKLLVDIHLALFEKNFIAIRTFNTIRNRVRIGAEVLDVESDPFNFSPLIFVGGKKTTYAKVIDIMEKGGLDTGTFSAMMNTTERGYNPSWREFKDSDLVVIDRNNRVYSLHSGDLIMPEPKA